MELLEVFGVRPVMDKAGERTDSDADDVVFFIFFERMVSIFFVKTVRGISGSARTLAK